MSNKLLEAPPPPRDPTAAARPIDHTVLLRGQLVAYVHVGVTPGAVLRASGKEAVRLAELPYAGELRCYAKAHEALLLSLAEQASELDALLFKLGLEGFDVLPGQVSANAAKRRF